MRVRIVMSAAAAIVAAAWVQAGARSAEARNHFQAPDGKAVYAENCKQCHGVIGAPTKSSLSKYEKIPNFQDSSFFAARSQDSIIKILKKGKGKDMKSFSEKLTPEEMTAVAQYIRTLAKK
jgi:mono/diheme cytochrome c family protein